MAPPSARDRTGFTMLELVVVVAVIAALTVSVVATLDGVQDGAELNVARSEMTEIRDAVRRFKADTGYLPRNGPFALVEDGGMIDPAVDAHWPDDLRLSSQPEREAWFRSAANVYQLRQRGNDPGNLLLLAGCLDRYVGHDAVPGQTWNAPGSRGFRGPYLARDASPQVVGPFPAVPVALDPWGRAYELYLAPSVAVGDPGPRVHSIGPDGEPGSDDDLTVFILE